MGPRHVTTNIKHVEPYTFSPFTYNEEAFARFEGREPVRPRNVQVPEDTTHANVERPPHVDPGTEAPPPLAVKTI